ncbi:MAG: TIGR03084 family protein [Actinomycetia bacterium]|nr:TIGR03084 family protein [Actinomycetes bacterium]MCP4225084.1 TIGR03084 family protein [Actinomycetes bacterium]MCP5031712.1 TIGR03084 family protein [Actinomycetes bacterium]
MAHLVGPSTEQGERVEEEAPVWDTGHDQAQDNGSPEHPYQLPFAEIRHRPRQGLRPTVPVNHRPKSSWLSTGSVVNGTTTRPLIYHHAVEQICNDLASEHDALDAIVATLTEDQWALDTAAEGWDVADTVVHLIQADMAARLAVTDPDRFQQAKADMATKGFEGVFGDKTGKTGAEVLAWWRQERTKMLDAFRGRGPKDRIAWFGPDMSTLSFATARLMETWSHGLDVADAVGAPWPPSERIRHVAHIGVSTRGWSYVNRGQEIPAGDIRVELTAPSGEVWTWGPENAENRVTGSALDFCLVATQRRHPADTGLEAEGALAEEWIGIAQAFAGPPTLPQASRAGS